MSKTDDQDAVRAFTQTMRIIVTALALGVILFSVMALGLLRNDRPSPPDSPRILGLPMLTAMAILAGALSAVASFVAPRLMTDDALRRIAKGPPLGDAKLLDSDERRTFPTGDVGRLLPVFQSGLIIASALNEGAAFFAVLAYMIEGQSIALIVAAVLIAILISRFPTVDRVGGWLDAQLERLTQLRRENF